MAFSAEIGRSTVGGVCFCTTKDSAVGPLCPSGNLGDFRNGLMSITIVNSLGALEEVRLFDERGQKNERFQQLLRSVGTQGIAVRACIATRPATTIQTSLHFQAVSRPDKASELVRSTYTDAKAHGGNAFAIISDGMVFMEYRTTESQGCAPFSWVWRNLYEPLKRILFLLCWIPGFFRVLHCLSGSWAMRFWNSPRREGFLYPLKPLLARRLTFSYATFDFRLWDEVVAPGLEWAAAYKARTGFGPNGFVVYFTTQNDQTIAPHSGQDEGTAFSFDPIYHDARDPRWETFCAEFSVWARDKGGFPAINQTYGIDKFPEWGATVVSGTPDPRFLTKWLRPFFDARGP